MARKSPVVFVADQHGVPGRHPYACRTKAALRDQRNMPQYAVLWHHIDGFLYLLSLSQHLLEDNVYLIG
jgi:hypothetical protein